MSEGSVENIAVLRRALQEAIESKEECPVCYEKLTENAVITRCRHTFCMPCIRRAIQSQRKCPLCRQRLELQEGHLVGRAGGPINGGIPRYRSDWRAVADRRRRLQGRERLRDMEPSNDDQEAQESREPASGRGASSSRTTRPPAFEGPPPVIR